jgi:signal transduction histidine kinase
MFYRGSNTGTGTGLGLYICKQIMDKLNGSITLASTPGKGSIFTVHFPECDVVHEPISTD